jgi:uncharacterized membrane protein required for colicin V production
MAMGLVDVVIIAALVFFVYKGAQTGMADELWGATGWIIALLAAVRFAAAAADILARKLPSIPLMLGLFLGFALVLTGMRSLLVFLASLLPKMFGSSYKSFNKFMGAVLGFLKGCFFISVMIMCVCLSPLNDDIKDYKSRSALFTPMTRFAQVIIDAVGTLVPQIPAAYDKAILKSSAPTDQE